MEHGLDAVDHERVAGVVTAVKTDHDLGLGSEPIDEFSLALVAPLSADRDQRRHGPSSTSCAEIRWGRLCNCSITASSGARSIFTSIAARERSGIQRELHARNIDPALPQHHADTSHDAGLILDSG